MRVLNGEVRLSTPLETRSPTVRSLLLRPSQEFETQILLLPPTSTFASDSSGASPRIVELPPSPSSLSSTPTAPSRTTAHLVHFHVPHSSTSRDLHMTLSRLSAQHASPSLAFSVLDASADENQSTCYDLGLATGPTSRDVPLVRLYVGGKVRAQAPAGEGEAKRAVRQRRLADKKAPKEERESEASEEDESEDEREVEQEKALSRYRWDTSAVRPRFTDLRLFASSRRPEADGPCRAGRHRAHLQAARALGPLHDGAAFVACSLSVALATRRTHFAAHRARLALGLPQRGEGKAEIRTTAQKVQQHAVQDPLLPPSPLAHAQHRSNVLYSASSLVVSTIALSSMSLSLGTRYCRMVGHRMCSTPCLTRACASAVGVGR